MGKKFIFSLLLLGLVLALGAQTVEQFKIPDIPPYGGGNVKCPSVATNSRGDMMIVIRNKLQSIMYYFKKKSTGAITQTRVPGAMDKDIISTSVVATADDNFHATWGVLITTWPEAVGIGVFYTDFDIATEKWTTPVRLIPDYPYDPFLRVNPLNDDIVLVSNIRSGSIKDVYVQFRKKGQTAWTNEINISSMGHAMSATQPYACFDEQGYLYIVWKEDRAPGVDELIIKAALLKQGTDGIYKIVDKKWATSNYSGWHFIPSVAVVGTKGIITFAWKQKNAYFYLPFERSGDTLVFDQNNLKEIVAAPPGVPYMFYSKAVAHGDEIMYTYFDVNKKLQLLRWKDNAWLDSSPITLGNMTINKAPFNVWADSNRGLYATWFVEAKNGDGTSYYSIFDYPKPKIKPPVDITYTKAMERSMFRGIWLYDVKWANNPENVTLKITVVKFNIYRRARGSGGSWVAVGSADGTDTSFGDVNGITATSDFEYTVTAVNDKGVESPIQSIGAVAAKNEKNLETGIWHDGAAYRN
jgi:hypothetical protein